MTKRYLPFFALSIACSALGGPISARGEQYANSVAVEKLLTTTSDYTGKSVAYLKTDSPEITVLVVHVPPGGSTGWHLHRVPVYAYMLEGELTVEMKNGTGYTFTKGQPIIEVMNTLHNGRNNGKKEASLVVFYTGGGQLPNVVREELAGERTAASKP